MYSYEIKLIILMSLIGMVIYIQSKINSGMDCVKEKDENRQIDNKLESSPDKENDIIMDKIIKEQYSSEKIKTKIEEISDAHYRSIKPSYYEPGIDQDAFKKWNFFDVTSHDNIHMYFKDCTIYEIDEILYFLPEYLGKAIKRIMKEIEGCSKSNDTNKKVIRYSKGGNIEFLGDKRNGNGTFFYSNERHRYMGEIKEELEDGVGREYYDKEYKKYQGDTWNDLAYGNGKEIVCSYIKYEGEWEKGLMNGLGRLYDEFGNLRYEGYFLRGKKNGCGRVYLDKDNFVECLVIEDRIIHDIKDGNDLDRVSNDDIKELKVNINKQIENHCFIEYEGKFKKGLRDGTGSLFNWRGFIVFEGEFKRGRGI